MNAVCEILVRSVPACEHLECPTCCRVCGLAKIKRLVRAYVPDFEFASDGVVGGANGTSWVDPQAPPATF